MTDALPEQQLSDLSDFVAAAMGLYFPRERWNDLERQTKLAAKEFGFTGAEPFLAWLLCSPLSQEQVESLASYLTISETYFWREPHVFEALRDQILPELIRKRESNGRLLRMWSAGCATGEEPYSIAIALREALPYLKNWRITLLATDINPRILRRAMRGVYGEWSFRNSPPGFKDNYFSCLGKGKYELQAEIRNMVTFAYHNLAADAFPTPMNDTNAMDLIFCRNVLMYFSPARARLVGQRLYNCLVEGGWLIVSASELSQHTFAQFDATNFPGAIVYRRPSGKLRPAEALRIEKPKPAKKKPLPPPATGAVQPVAAFPGSPQPEWAHPAEFVETAPLATPPPDVLQVVRALANQGRLFEAWAACESALKADKLDPSLHYLAATILQELKRDDEAMTMLKRALYLNPNFLPAYFTLGNLAQRCGNTAIASKAFKNVLALLEGYQADDILPEAEGLTVGRLREIVRLTLQTRAKQ